MSFKNKFKDVGNKPKLPPQLQILEDAKNKSNEEVKPDDFGLKKKSTYFTETRAKKTGSVIMTEGMAEVADVQSYDDRPNNVKEHSGGGEKGSRVF